MKPVNKKKNTRADKNFKSEFKRCFSIWSLQHLQAFIHSLGQYVKYPISNLLTTAVIGISLALPASFYLLLDNVRFVSPNWDGSLKITLFLQTEIDDEQALSFTNKLRENKNINETVLIKRDDAFAEYKKLSGFADALNALDENPLPNVVLVEPVFGGMNEVDTDNLVKELKAMAEVDNAQYDNQWIKRLFYLFNIINRVIIILSALLAIGVLLIVGNTIRLSIYTRRSEIEITKLFGGTDSFIQRPFLYSGLWYGAFGGFIAWLLIGISMQMLREPIKQLANLYASDFQLIGLGFIDSVLLIGIGIILGLCGSWISVKHHLKVIDPV